MIASIENFASIASGSVQHKAATLCYNTHGNQEPFKDIFVAFSWIQELSDHPDRYSLTTGGSELIKQHWLSHNHSLAFECILINGKYEPSLSQLPEGVFIYPIHEASVSFSTFMHHLDVDAHPLAFLNAVCSDDQGVVIYVPENVEVTEPIFVRHITFPVVSEPRVIFSPRIVIILAQGASAEVQVSHHTQLENGVSISHAIINGATELFVAEDAELSLWMAPRYLAKETLSWSHIATVKQEGKCKIIQNFLDAPHGYGFFDNTCYMVDQGAYAEILVAIQSPKKTWVKNLMRHDAEQTTSRQDIKSILYSGHFLFEGGIYISPCGELSDAYQKHSTLLLNSSAQVSTYPRLEILADNVKASHGATIGPLDPKQIFYMRSRGMTEVEAQGKLVEGFLAQGLSYGTFFDLARQNT
ncbi:SufD family Fe-S cluster assembly protein [Candidatus Chlamydia sanziniae]|uniref:Iron-sulfur cluster assembly protein SufD n=1 Tax=Candidatus Chlamydia sanziniae TaxID=1806891 RepID=A0A1A9HWS7_9CHLA|nr:SufD family Fe-S cluster assembly protein [Candidatus Chlamydia sanziniae]ANH78494.1 Iron-sulfur cluster assembly protein SufD [Candidatus Chlamydia sanziniae]